jgi:arsenical pump membrane protein
LKSTWRTTGRPIRICANITITGALAGILWIECAKAEKWSTGISEFIKTGLTVTPIVILASSAVLAIELILF